MPAIRDKVFSTESDTGDAGLTMTLPANQAGDLLLLYCVVDSGYPTWTEPTGWTPLFSQNSASTTNGSSFCAWKISSGSEPATVSVGATVNETYCGFIISVENVHQTYPFGNPAVHQSSAFAGVSNGYYTYPALTTTEDNALVLALHHAAGNTPMFFQNNGMVTGGWEQGTDVGASFGWFIQPSTGVCPAIMGACFSTAIANIGTVATLQIVPPAAGEVVLPAYISSDDSVFFMPIGTAFDGQPSAQSAVSTTFGATIAGLTVVDGAAASTGNSHLYKSLQAQGFSGTLSPSSITGMEVVLRAASDFSNRLLFLHVNPAALIDSRRIDSVASKRGGSIGVRSSGGTNFKLWSVFGTDVKDSQDYFKPILINLGTTTTIASIGTLVPSNVLGIGLFFGTNAAVAANMRWMNIWGLGVIAVAGGAPSKPIQLAALLGLIYEGRNRKSAVFLTDTQALLYQPLQFGDGENTTHLDLDATALSFAGYNAEKKEVSAHIVADDLGLKYYPSAGSSIKHRNSSITSSTRFHWGLHANASASATYDFTRLSVIGAGTITLNKAITVDRLIINDYVTADISNATLTNCTIAKPPSTNDSLTTNSSTSLTGCTIDISTVGSGNRWCSVANPSIFSSCAFTGGGGHAIRITSPGTYSFTGNTLAGFGANGSDGAFFYNDSGGAVTINISGGSTPTYKNGSGASTVVNNASTVTIEANTSLVGAEIRIYDLDDDTPPISYGTELSGVESHNAATYQFSTDATNLVLIQIMKDGYVEFVQSYTVPSGSSTFTALLTRELNA